MLGDLVPQGAAMNVEFIARITCECGATADVPAEIEIQSGCGPFGGGPCTAELSCTAPDGWLGGYDEAHPYECPACVARRYA